MSRSCTTTLPSGSSHQKKIAIMSAFLSNDSHHSSGTTCSLVMESEKHHESSLFFSLSELFFYLASFWSSLKWKQIPSGCHPWYNLGIYRPLKTLQQLCAKPLQCSTTLKNFRTQLSILSCSQGFKTACDTPEQHITSSKLGWVSSIIKWTLIFLMRYWIF